MSLKTIKGQATIEMMTILAVSIAALMVIMGGSQERLITAESRFADAQIDSSLSNLVDAANFAYSQSIGTSREVTISVPKNVMAINVLGHCFEFVKALPGGGNNTKSECSIPSLEGNLTLGGGTQIKLTNMGRYVEVAQY